MAEQRDDVAGAGRGDGFVEAGEGTDVNHGAHYTIFDGGVATPEGVLFRLKSCKKPLKSS